MHSPASLGWSLVRVGLLLGLVSGAAQAAGPFDASTLAPDGAEPLEGQTFRYTLTIAAPRDASSATVEISVPTAAMFVGLRGLDGAALDADARVVRWQGAVEPGGTRTVVITMVAGLDAGGQQATVRATIRPWDGEPTYLAHVAEVGWRPTPSAFRIGPIGVTAAGVAVLGWMGMTALVWGLLLLRRWRAATWAPIAIMVPAGFLLYFGAMAREDARITALPQETCVVTDRVLDTRTGSSSTSSSSGPTTIYAPRLALRWGPVGAGRVAQGFGTDSRLSRGSASSAEALLARYRIGASVPCAIDDRDPRRGYVERGFGGAYLFALIPLPVLAIGLWGITRRRR